MTKKIDEPEGWKEEFTELNEKLGNDVWGARLEGAADEWTTIRVYVSEHSLIKQVDSETGGAIAGLSLVYTVYSQEQHAKLEAKRSE